MLTGHVTAFDPVVGWGQVTTSHGDSYPFHATAIASARRTIDIGEAVAFVCIAGRIGCWEAAQVTLVTGQARLVG